MNVVLVHPVHGAKVAICEQEITGDEKNGWTRYEAAAPVVTTTPDAPAKRKKGHPVVEGPTEVPGFLTPVGNGTEGA